MLDMISHNKRFFYSNATTIEMIKRTKKLQEIFGQNMDDLKWPNMWILMRTGYAYWGSKKLPNTHKDFVTTIHDCVDGAVKSSKLSIAPRIVDYGKDSLDMLVATYDAHLTGTFTKHDFPNINTKRDASTLNNRFSYALHETATYHDYIQESLDILGPEAQATQSFKKLVDKTKSTMELDRSLHYMTNDEKHDLHMFHENCFIPVAEALTVMVRNTASAYLNGKIPGSIESQNLRTYSPKSYDTKIQTIQRAHNPIII